MGRQPVLKEGNLCAGAKSVRARRQGQHRCPLLAQGMEAHRAETTGSVYDSPARPRSGGVRL